MSANLYDRLQQRPVQAQKTSPPPPRYLTNELSFVRPEGFVDQTFHVLVQAETQDNPLNIVIGRGRINAKETLESMTQRLLREMEQRLDEFHLIQFQAEQAIDGVPACSVECCWRQQGKRLHQIQILFLHQDEQGEALSLQITATSNNPWGMSAEERQGFARFLSSVRLHHKAAPSA